MVEAAHQQVIVEDPQVRELRPMHRLPGVLSASEEDARSQVSVSPRYRFADPDEARLTGNSMLSEEHDEAIEFPCADEIRRMQSTATNRQHRTVTGLIQGCVQDLVDEAGRGPNFDSEDTAGTSLHSVDRHKKAIVAPRLLSALGVLRWSEHAPLRSGVYQCTVRAAILAAAVYFLVGRIALLVTVGSLQDIHQGALAEIPLPLGAVFGIGSLGFARSGEKLRETFALIGRVSDAAAAQDKRSRRLPGLMYVFLWLLGVVQWFWHHVASAPVVRTEAILEVVLLSTFSAVILSVSFGMVCVSLALSNLIDELCCEIVDDKAILQATRAWNLMQAVLRQAASSLEQCLVTVCVIAAVVIPLILVDVLRSEHVFSSSVAGLPTLTVVFGVLFVVFTAATISEKCARVPALVNAISFGPGTEQARQQVVDYIVSSAAGFYVFGVRLNTAMVFKFAYGWAVIAVGMFSRVIAHDYDTT